MAKQTKSSKPAKAPKAKEKAKRSPPPAAAPREPEVLNQATVAADESPPRRPVRVKEEKALNDLAELLAVCTDLVPVKDAIVQLHGGDWTPDRELSVLKLIKGDDRFIIVNRDRVNLVGSVANNVVLGKVRVGEVAAAASEATSAENQAAAETAAAPPATSSSWPTSR